MTEAAWLQSADPLELLQPISSDSRTPRKLRLATCAWLRQYWHLLPDERSRRAVEVAERFVDGLATDEERNAAHLDAARAPEGLPPVRSESFKHVAYAACAAKIVVASRLVLGKS